MIATFSIEDLIAKSKQNPPDPIIEGLIFKGDICLIHGQEASYKSIFVFQMADNIAGGTPLLRRFKVPRKRRVGVVETELHDAQLGERLAQMFTDGKPPEGLRVFAAMDHFRAAHSMDSRLKLMRHWIAQEGIEVLFLDIASDFFRGQNDNPSDERVVASFFEQLRDMGLTSAVVRHDHKPRAEDYGDGNTNNRIRGSGEWKEDPEVIVGLSRNDRRTNQIELEVGKLRYGSRPEPMKPWFDAGPFRLTLLPAVIAALENGPLARRDLLAACEKRFGLSARKTDELIQQIKPFISEKQQRHEKLFELNAEAITAVESDDEDVAVWRRLVHLPDQNVEAVVDVQDCITSSLLQGLESSKGG